jgi:hypothetical protein
MARLDIIATTPLKDVGLPISVRRTPLHAHLTYPALPRIMVRVLHSQVRK